MAAFLARPRRRPRLPVASARPARPRGRVGVVAGLDSQAVDAPFAGTAVEHVLMGLAQSRARTMGCGDIVARPAARRLAA